MVCCQDDDDLVNQTPDGSDELFGSAPRQPPRRPRSRGDDDDEPLAADWAEGPEAAPRGLKHGEIVRAPWSASLTTASSWTSAPRSRASSPCPSSPRQRPARQSTTRSRSPSSALTTSTIRSASPRRRADYERVWNELEELRQGRRHRPGDGHRARQGRPAGRCRRPRLRPGLPGGHARRAQPRTVRRAVPAPEGPRGRPPQQEGRPVAPPGRGGGAREATAKRPWRSSKRARSARARSATSPTTAPSSTSAAWTACCTCPRCPGRASRTPPRS